jgi:putative nucleotidyltransferase with HDIG domain
VATYDGVRVGPHVGGRLERNAIRLAEELVAPLGRRWQHVQAVAARAAALSAGMTRAEREVLVTAAWLHDIGYAEDLALTGLHPLDGANYLEANGWPEPVVVLVAHHSGARYEARERGLTLDGYPFEDTDLSDALAAADLTTGPGGEGLTYDERMIEILGRYPADHPVHRTWVTAAPVIGEAVARAEARASDAELAVQSATG